MKRRTYKRPFILYHWAPVSRRASISKQGIRIRQRTTASGRLKEETGEEWRAGWSCWSDSPSLAWALSARFLNTSKEWDLWMMWSNSAKKPIGRRDDLGKRNFPTEYRVFENIPKSKLWHCGTKRHVPKKRIAAEKLNRGKVMLR